MILPLIAILFVLLILSGFFSSTETAYTSLSAVQVKKLYEQEGRKGRWVKKLSEKPQILLTTLLIGNNLVNIAASALATTLTIELLDSSFLGVTTGLLTLIVLIFCEVTPKQIALVKNESICLFTAGIILFLSYLFRPLIWIISGISVAITRIFSNDKQKRVSIESLLHMVDMAGDMGVVEHNEKEMVRKVFRINNIHAEEIMTHRKDVFCLEQELTLAASFPLILERGFSRIPVYDEHPENIVGIVLLKDILKETSSKRGSLKLKDILLKPIFISERKHADSLFIQLKKAGINMAIVLDEYGGLAGIVTREDILEEIFGELYDEGEIIQEEKVEKQGNGRWKIKGDADFYDIQDSLNLHLEHDSDTLTLGGYLMEKLQSIPEEGETINLPEGLYLISKMENNQILEILFSPKDKISSD